MSGPGSLVGNSGGTLVGNSGGTLVGNSGGTLVGGPGAAYRTASVAQKVVNGFVYLTAPDERFYVAPDRRLYGGLTDSEGRFTLARPATDSVVVNVLLRGNRRLTAFVTPATEGAMTVNLASTLVTEFLRSKAAHYGFTFSQVLQTPGAQESIARLTRLTEALSESDSVLATFKPSDLALNNLPLLRQRYVAAFGTAADRALSDEWVNLLRLVLHDASAPDWKYRPLAITTLPADIPVGNTSLGVAVDANGTVYFADQNRSTTEIRSLTAQGVKARLLSKVRSGGDALDYVANLAMGPGGKLLIPDSNNLYIALLDPAAAVPGNPFMDSTDPGSWTNPRLLYDAATYASDSAGVADVAVDDKADPGLYFADDFGDAIWYVPHAFTADPVEQDKPFAGLLGEPPSGDDPVPASRVVDLKLNNPSAVTFHRRASDRVPFLYVADGGDHALVEIDLDSGAVRRIAGVVPPDNSGKPRKPLCYTPEEEGSDPLAAHLRFPHKILFDSHERLVFADTDNSLVRLVTVYDPTPAIWSIAGIAQPDDDGCKDPGRLPSFAFEDGEARNVAIGSVQGMALDPAGNLILSDVQSNRIRKLWLSHLK